MRHSNQTLLFDSFMNSHQDQSLNVNNLNVFKNNNNKHNNNHNEHIINNINVVINSNDKNHNKLIDRDIALTANLNMDNWLKEDMDIFHLYSRAKQNLNHSNRILNLTWRRYNVRLKQNCVNGSNKISLIDRYRVENSFLFQESSVLNQFNANSEYPLLNRQKFSNINYNNGYSSNHENNNNIFINNAHSIIDTNSNFFIDDDNFITRDNEFDMFTEDLPSSVHETLVTPLPMDIPQSLPNHMLHYSNSFDQDHISSPFIIQHMTPLSLTSTPTPTTSFAPTPSVPLTSTTKALVFNKLTILNNEETISISLPETSDLLKQKKFGAAVTSTTKKRTATRNNNTNNNSNSPSAPTRCSNCETHNTPLWRKGPQGNSLCNACGLFLKLHGVMRPLSLKTDTIKKRQRNTNSNNTNNTKKNYNVKKVVSRDKINLSWLNINL